MVKVELVDKRVLVTEDPKDCIINQMEAKGYKFIQVCPYSLPYVLVVFEAPVNMPKERVTVASPKEDVNSLTGK